MATITIPGGRVVHYDQHGEGDPLILINGLGGARTGWASVADAFSQHFRVVALDNRDAGESDPETEPYSLDDLADDVAGLMDALGIDRAHVLGHSMGGFIALHFAVNHPDRLNKLVLVGTSPVAGVALGQPFTGPTREEWIDDAAERTRETAPSGYAPGFFDTHPELMDALVERARSNRITWEGYRRQCRAISETHDVRDRLGDITAPTLVIHGDVDPSVSIKGGKKLATGIPNAQMLTYEGVGHHPMREAPERFERDVLSFLE
jgi:pimeloyl-ACP methyl ester carboxylesterase